MRWMLALVLAACGSKSDKPAPPPAPVDVTWAPRVASANVLATWSDPPPPVIVLDAAGNGLLATVTTWDALSKANPATGAEPLTATAIALLNPGFGPRSPVQIKEEEDDSSVGAAVNLEEMPRKREPEPPAVAERNAFLGVAGGAVGDKRYEQPASAMPLHKVIGEVMMDGAVGSPSAVIVAAPTAKAGTLVDVLARTHAALGVVHERKVRPLRISFAERGDRQYIGRSWMELRVSAKELALELVPDTPIRAEMPTLVSALAQLRRDNGLDPRTRVDVLVEDDADVQRLVDVLVALDQASVLMIGLGHAPATDSDAAKQRGARRPSLWFSQPNVQGDMDKAIIRNLVRAQHGALSACHTKELATQPTLSGTLDLVFFIHPSGKVATARAEGIHPLVATCVQNVIKAIEFPKPAGGGGVQVSYPLSFRR